MLLRCLNTIKRRKMWPPCRVRAPLCFTRDAQCDTYIRIVNKTKKNTSRSLYGMVFGRYQQQRTPYSRGTLSGFPSVRSRCQRGCAAVWDGNLTDTTSIEDGTGERTPPEPILMGAPTQDPKSITAVSLCVCECVCVCIDRKEWWPNNNHYDERNNSFLLLMHLQYSVYIFFKINE